MNYWLLKTEPGTYSWSDIVKDKTTEWTGVRNYQARNFLRAMKVGDLAFIYHSNTDKAVVGIAKIIREAQRDSTATDGDWSSVEIAFHKNLKRPISLAEIKSDPSFKNMVLAQNSRLSVQPVTKNEWEAVLVL